MEIQHQHPLILEDLQSMYLDYEEDDDEFDDNDLIAKQSFKCTCDMCGLDIDWYHRYYYKCNSCNYSLHKFCSELSPTLRFPAHPIHTLSLKKGPHSWSCEACLTQHQSDHICYHCSTCNYAIDLPCVTFVEQTTIHHPGHPHPLICATLDAGLNNCFACGKKHEGVFYHCVTCFNFSIHVDCVTLPFKFQVENQLHKHMLTLSYSFTLIPDNSKCRICRLNISDRLWLYKCSKCRFYVHIDCATSRGEPFMSIFSRGMVKTDANFIAADYPDLLRYPLPDESYNIIPHQVQKGKNYKHFDQTRSFIDEKYNHEHQLRVINDTSISGIQLHDPMKRIKLICSGCVRPITSTPFYVCSFMMQDNDCDFCLHEWCTRLPMQLENHPGHPQHTLDLFHLLPTDVSTILTGFECGICRLRFNGFGYACSMCDYRVDVNCGFIPEKITHESHSRDHLLSLVNPTSIQSCEACDVVINEICYKCISCDFYLDSRCALHLPKTIKNKYDKHPLKLSYSPIENHKSQYFCEVCEEDLNPEKWFYHCIECGQSIHTACAPLILQSEQDVNSSVHVQGVYMFLNMKLPALIQNLSRYLLAGVKSHGVCFYCGNELQSSLILKSSEGDVVQDTAHLFCVVELVKLMNDTNDSDLFDKFRDLFDKFRKSKEKLIEHQMSEDRVRLTFYPAGRVTRPVTGHWKPDGGVIIKHP